MAEGACLKALSRLTGIPTTTISADSMLSTELALVDFTITVIIKTVADLLSDPLGAVATGVDQLLIDTTITVVVSIVTDLQLRLSVRDTEHRAIYTGPLAPSADPRFSRSTLSRFKG